MKKLIYLLILLPVATGCKNRQVTTVKSQSTDKSVIITTKHDDLQYTDTGKVTSDISASTMTKDSAEVIITPDSGTVQVVKITTGNGFNYFGKAKQIVFKANTLNQNLLKTISDQQNRLNIRQSTLDSAVEKKNVSLSSKSKTVISKPNNLWPVLLITLILVLLFVFYKNFKNIA
jgi:hypothetical protein